MIIPVILEKNLDEIIHKVNVAEKKAQQIQIDIADGSISHGDTYTNINEISKIKSSANIEIHLMVQNPVLYLEKKFPNITHICSQIETSYTDLFIKEAKVLGYKVGLSVNINTQLSELDGYPDLVDYIQFLGVEAGAQGRILDPQVLTKMTAFRDKYPNKPFQIDGGVHLNTVSDILKTGVTNLVIGSGLFAEPNFDQAFNKFQELSK